ncbi:phosphatidylinositol kinase-related protein kinase TOR1 KNAG_0B00160 [Huiozyma naganishii CBS 8797]|uniref:Serine/threonine-protein kinase TOR n=1 Tax=Huiozyma naganishii (strain ATCC MYA-139 / BCRC 22969 / CBS 8797 / KCTC 17520 / NBRC 10181 / NCYC 3082 / Yp74L-3) TaxID=1071383 RepID=J7R113_HUIN7|nr:hypothetical protein KNAG_0B00160 [Kazachstania naganishii CBS 8797]CCK68465.1 hypothetical protein KNAG_0B00160 [Kazachstania naganishii CBS 8797]
MTAIVKYHWVTSIRPLLYQRGARYLEANCCIHCLVCGFWLWQSRIGERGTGNCRDMEYSGQLLNGEDAVGSMSRVVPLNLVQSGIVSQSGALAASVREHGARDSQQTFLGLTAQPDLLGTDPNATLSMLDSIMAKLKSPHTEERLVAVKYLETSIVLLARESSAEDFQQVESFINNRVVSMIKGSSSNERIGGILAVNALIRFYSDIEELPRNAMKLTNALRALIPSSDIEVMRLAADTMWKLALPGNPLMSDFVEMEIKNCTEWLTTSPENTIFNSKQENKKHAAILLIGALAANSPYTVAPYVTTILDNIWRALRDSRAVLRADAAKTVENCLLIVKRRDRVLLTQWIERLLDSCSHELTLHTTESIHSSLLIYKVALRIGDQCLAQYYDAIFQASWNFRDIKTDLIREETYNILPMLALNDVSQFSANYLDQTMLSLLKKLQNPAISALNKKDLPLIFKCIGDIAAVVGIAIDPYIVAILDAIRAALNMKYKNRMNFERETFYCIANLAIASGSMMARQIDDSLLDSMLNCPLSDYMQRSLETINEKIPELEPIISSRLLDLISCTLSGNKFCLPGSPSGLKLFSAKTARIWRNENDLRQKGKINDDANDTKIVIQALCMLQTINYKYPMTEFVRGTIISYIEHNDPRVRELAAVTSCDLFVRDDICRQTSANSLNAVSEVLSKLLTVAITDMVPEIRLQIVRHMNPCFDVQLVQPENIRLLFALLNDEVFAIRVEVLRVIGRLTSVNPAYVVPSLRKALLQLLTELKYVKIPRKNEECLTMLYTLISSTKEITKPYIDPILTILILKMQDISSSVSATALKAVGELSIVGAKDMLGYLKELMPLIINALRDQSNSYKRNAALKAFGQLSSSSGYVIDPFLDFPEILTVLINILKSEATQNVKRETVRLIGTLGALDPYKHREVEETSKNSMALEQNTPSIDIALLMQNVSPSNDEYYPTVVITILLKILKDNSLISHHTAVIQAIVQIFQTLKLRCVTFLGQIIPAMIEVMNSCSYSLLDFYFQQMGVLISIVKQHIRPHADEILTVIQKYLETPKLQLTIITVIETLCSALKMEFRKYIPTTLTQFLNILEGDKTPDKTASIAILHCLLTFDDNLEEYTYLIVPTIIKLAEFSTTSLKRTAIITLGKLTRSISLSDMSSRIVHTSVRSLDTRDPETIRLTMNTLILLLLQLNEEFTVFIPVVNKALIKNNIKHSVYDELVHKTLNKEPLPPAVVLDQDFEKSSQENNEVEQEPKKLQINQSLLKSTWDCTQQRTKEDWQEWLRRLSIQLLKESPSHSLRACAGLAGVYPPLAKELINAAFASIWNELFTQYQEDLIQSLCLALSSPQNPPEIHQTLLNLVEFMEHDDKPLPIPSQKLGQYAEMCHAYAKALHFKEVKFVQEPIDNAIVESLISINNQIYQNDAAVGILKFAQKHHNLQLQETWYEKLQRWDDALQAYTKRAEAGETSTEVVIGHMRSLHALSDWDNLSKVALDKWDMADSTMQKSIAPLAAGAAWSLGDWNNIKKYIFAMKPLSPDREFFSAVLNLHENNFDDAEKHIFNARDLLVTEISALINESYNRAYNVVVRTQLITELEEIISYKKLPPNSEKRTVLRETWNKRLLGCQKNVDIWQRVLKVRSLVVKPKQDMQIWIKFANLCRKSGKLNLAEKALNSLLDDTSDGLPVMPAKAPPPVVYAQLKYLWANGSQQEALRYLIGFTSKMAHDLGLDPSNMIAQNLTQSSSLLVANVEEYTKLLARCFLKQGEWRVALQPEWRAENPDAILGSYLLATHFDSKWYKAWHNWALANFDVISSLTAVKKPENESNELLQKNMELNGTGLIGTDNLNKDSTMFSTELIQRHVVPAIKGFFHSISLSSTSSLQDTLRLLTLWFTFGGQDEAADAMQAGFRLIKIDNWLEVLPQLISRIHQPNETVSRSLLSLLSDLGKAHPQVMVNPLIVAIKSESVSRQKAALSIIEKMKLHSTKLVIQAELVSDELIRVAVLWYELWYEGLEDASRQFFGEHNTEKMFATLEPLHELLKREPETIRELSFQNMFSRDLNDAYEWVLNYKRSKDTSNLNQAWDIYYNVFRRISRQLPQLQTLDLQHVSPKLLLAKDLEMAVPGTYVIGKPIISISYFDPIFTVISSKQRPRKFSVRGNDGKDYQYVLKGHEDLRQDSLVMQLFGLVNTLLGHDAECFKRHLDIQKYPAIPLSPKSGILGWVPYSDTFHVLIRDHRDANKVPLNIEHWVMLQMAPDYDSLTLLEKIEVFQYAMDNTKGQDLAQVLWLKSKSSEAWLDRRTVFTRSLAVMSMVGYILGLGDRHPSNLMLDRITGKVIHIDFGDCFEAAILREKFPEKVPFRLTRMLIKAMEVSGIEGSFRIVCENVMRVLRDNKESLIAILEAFAFDPLIHWGFDLPTEKIIEETGIQLPLINPSELLRKGAITVAEAGKLESEQQAEIRNARALLVLRRITDKLTGNDISRFKGLEVADQVDKLLQQAMSIENLCQHYVGWCPFW